MSLPILTAHDVKSLETRIIARGTPLSDLIKKAVEGCTDWIKTHYPLEQFPTVGLLVGSGHNGADALGIGRLLCNEGRQVLAVVVSSEDSLKPATRLAVEELHAAGGKIVFFNEPHPIKQNNTHQYRESNLSLWIDGLQGFGLNRPLEGTHAAAVRMLNEFSAPVVAIDLPSGLHADLGLMQPEYSTFVHAQDTLALGCLKPVHVIDSTLRALGRVHLIDMNYSHDITIQQLTQWRALTSPDIPALLQQARRPAASHKYKNGRVLVIAGSKRYPGAAVMACLGAQISGAGMIHALVPFESRQAILTHAPEIIFESRLPKLESFSSIVIGPGWVPPDAEILQNIISHVRTSTHCRFVFDAGAFTLLKHLFARGEKLSERCVLTPHGGEFAQLFPEPAARMSTSESSKVLNTIQAAVWAAKMANAVIYFKGARTCIATPDSSARVIMNSTPLLAHAGHGDVIAGLMGGLLASSLSPADAAALTVLLQSTAALDFAAEFPCALTLPPLTLIERIQHLHACATENKM